MSHARESLVSGHRHAVHALPNLVVLVLLELDGLHAEHVAQVRHDVPLGVPEAGIVVRRDIGSDALDLFEPTPQATDREVEILIDKRPHAS